MASEPSPSERVRRRNSSWSEFSSTDTVEDRLLAVYRTVRPPGALAAGVGSLIPTFLFDWVFGWLAVGAAAVAFADSILELRSPRKSAELTILVDATLLGLTMVAIGLPAVSFAFGLWLVLLTAVLATGWMRSALFAYTATWVVVANIVTWSGAREWTKLEVLILDWTALLLVGALVVSLLELALRRVREMEDERVYMMGVVGHELGNALTSVTAIAATLDRYDANLSSDDKSRLLHSMRTQTQESADISSDLLALAGLKQDSLVVKHEPVDVWEETSMVVERTAESHGATIDLGSPPVDAWARADALRLRQVIRNLLINALDYGGDEIKVDVVTTNDQVRVMVSDDGDGISPGDLEHLFGPYRSSPGSGSGLGLWIAHRLAVEMEGDVTYSRDEADRTVFRVEFPRIEPPALESLPSSQLPTTPEDS